MHALAKGDQRTATELLNLRRQAKRDKAPRVMLRIQGILLSLDGYSTGEIAQRLKLHGSTIPVWIEQWNRHGVQGLWERHQPGSR